MIINTNVELLNLVVKSTLDIQPVKCDAKHKHRKKNAVVGDEDETDDSLNTSDSPQKVNLYL